MRADLHEEEPGNQTTPGDVRAVAEGNRAIRRRPVTMRRLPRRRTGRSRLGWAGGRTDDDNWDLTSSVGVTATIVAVGRLRPPGDPRGLINDPFRRTPGPCGGGWICSPR